MRSLILLALFIIFAVGVQADPFGTNLGTGDFVIASVVSTFRGTNYLSELKSGDIRNEPTWDEDKKPPLSASKVELLVMAYLEKKLHKSPPVSNLGFPFWNLENISIRRYFNTRLWYYEVAVIPYVGQSFNWPTVTLFVTMDGKVIPLQSKK